MCTIGFISNWHILYRTSSLVFLCLYTCTKRAPDRWKYTYTGYTVYPLFLSFFFFFTAVQLMHYFKNWKLGSIWSTGQWNNIKAQISTLIHKNHILLPYYLNVLLCNLVYHSLGKALRSLYAWWYTVVA